MAGHRGLKTEVAITAVVGIIQACPREFAAAIERRRGDDNWSNAAAEEFKVLFRCFKTEEFPSPTGSITEFTG